MDFPERRRYPRYPTCWAIEIKASTGGRVLSLRTHDVGRGGLFVLAEYPLELGAHVSITLVLPDETVFQVEGEVVHHLTPEHAHALNRAPGYGLSFEERYLEELKLLEVMASEGLDDSSEQSFSQDYLILPIARQEEERTAPTLPVAPEEAEEPEDAVTEQLGSADTDRHAVVPHDADEGTVPPPVDLRELEQAPALPPADVELIQAEKDEGETFSAGADSTQTRPTVIPDKPTSVEGSPAEQRDGTPKAEAEPGSSALDSSAERLPTIPDAPAVSAATRAIAPNRPWVFGIDFGTSFTSIAVVRDDRVALLEDEDGTTMIPSVVCYPDEGEPIVGWKAREKSLTFPSTTFRSPKRLIGRRFGDKRIDPFLGSSPVRTQAGPNGQVVAQVYGELIAIPQVCSQIFRYVAALAERATGAEVEHVLLSAPVSFDRERIAIKRAAELAGLHVVGVIDEPVAAAMAYGVVRAGEGLVAVYDFGGGTFDFTVLEVKQGKSTVIGEAGDDWLGGDDFDRSLAEQAAALFERQYHVDLRKRSVEWERLLMHCEQAKRKLSVQEAFELYVRGIVLSVRGGIDLRMHLDRQLFADVCGALIERSIDVVASCLELLELKPSDVNHLVLTGGVTRIPLVRQRVQEFFRQKAQLAVNPEHAIVLGNAIYGHVVRSRMPFIAPNALPPSD